MYRRMFDSLENMLLAGIAAIIILIVVGLWWLISFFFISDTYKSKTLISPDIVIETTTINGVQKSDTSYVYNLK